MTGILLASRAGRRYLAVLGGFAALGALCSRYGFKLQFAPAHDAVVLAVPEMCAVFLAAAALIVTRSRLWIIDRFGVRSRRWLPAIGAAVAVIAGPQLVLVAAVAAGVPEGTWPHAATSVLFLAALGVLVAPFAGTLRATWLMFGLELTLTVLAQLGPSIAAWSPLATIGWPSAGTVPVGRVGIAVLTTVAAFAVTVRTLGYSGPAWQRDHASG
ncbi:hypothetical protein [Actinoplanes sp. NPDC049316]|uniref:hypothetical protein n=1 Tax=Actinoplanes sp. NPDC049316 TaxID=3154727 RepID=UPI00342D22BB